MFGATRLTAPAPLMPIAPPNGDRSAITKGDAGVVKSRLPEPIREEKLRTVWTGLKEPVTVPKEIEPPEITLRFGICMLLVCLMGEGEGGFCEMPRLTGPPDSRTNVLGASG